KKLKEAGVESAALDARILLSHLLKMPMEKIILGNFSLSAEQEKEFNDLIQRRLNREPISHIAGIREFWGMDFKVTKDALDPRADTETMVEAALKLIPKDKNLRILDLGTGTGCILLPLLKEFTNSTGLGVDISEAALIVAGENSLNLGLSE